MKCQLRILKGNRHKWPLWLKLGLFRPEKRLWACYFRTRPLGLLYLHTPLFKLWLSIERRVLSKWYFTFLDQGVRCKD